MNNITQCTVTLTRNCNLRCSFCYAKKTEYIVSDNIDYDSLKRIVDFCDEARVKYIVFTGGEPSLYPRIIDILKYIKTKKNKMMPALATNGILLNDLNFCKDLINNGVEYIDISLKGKDGSECLKIVGRDCYMQQMTAIKNLSELPIEFTCSMVLTMENIFSFCETIEKACNSGAKQFSFTFVIDNEKSTETDINYLEKHNHFSLIEAFVSQIDKLNSLTKDWWIEYSYPMCAYTEEQLLLLKGKLAAPCQIRNMNGITFDTKLNLIPCNMYIDDLMGQLGKDFSSYKEYVDYAERNPYKSIIDSINQLPSRKCSSCNYIEACLGGCPITWKNCSFEAFDEFKNNYRL